MTQVTIDENGTHFLVTGTEKQHVADDYAERLSIGSEAAYQTMEVKPN